jgi:catechol 2,3-dioxygenase-like lactoylglutathione lyase family enzyme
MALELYMLGLVVRDMDTALEFYRRLGLAIPDGSAGQTHVEVKMGNGLTFFLDSNPARWDPDFVKQQPRPLDTSDGYHSVLEFYLKTRAAVDAKYTELTGCGYRGIRAPYEAPIGIYFALVADPDGHTILLSGDLDEKGSPQEG